VHPLVGWIGNNMEQFVDPLAPDRRDNAKLRKVCSDRIDHRGLLTDRTPLVRLKSKAPGRSAIRHKITRS
jgi:hypothetical protein